MSEEFDSRLSLLLLQIHQVDCKPRNHHYFLTTLYTPVSVMKYVFIMSIGIVLYLLSYVYEDLI